MKNTALLTVLTASFLLGIFACNPDCDSVAGLRVVYSSSPVGNEAKLGAPGTQILLTANPPSALNGRRIFFGKREATGVTFKENHGLVVTIPSDLPPGPIDLRIEDPDCVDYITVDFQVVESDFFFNSTDYVFPTFPEIVIPTLPPAFPASIENAWLSPDNLDYCMWFKFVKIDGKCTTALDPAQTKEQCFGPCRTDRAVRYKSNPVSGVIDSTRNFIHLIIDRTKEGLGYEELVGRFITPAETSAEYQKWEPGDEPISNPAIPVNTSRDHMMLLTSLSTGRTLLLYQQDLNVQAATKDCN
jgi:hypothetical protein